MEERVEGVAERKGRAKEVMIRALGGESEEEMESIGKPNEPEIALFGSVNVPISAEEEEELRDV